MDETSRGRGPPRQPSSQAPRGRDQGAPRGPRNDRQPASRQNQSDDMRGYSDSRYDTDRPRDREYTETKGGPPSRPNGRRQVSPNGARDPQQRSHLGKRQRAPGTRRDSDSGSDLDRSDYKPYPDGGRKRRAVDSPVNGRPVVASNIRSIPLKYDGGDVLEIEAEDLAKLMGFSNFRTTKNTKVPGNEFNYGVSKVKASQYRQYMNRVGGFNRPLSPTRGNKFAKPADTDP